MHEAEFLQSDLRYHCVCLSETSRNQNKYSDSEYQVANADRLLI